MRLLQKNYRLHGEEEGRNQDMGRRLRESEEEAKNLRNEIKKLKSQLMMTEKSLREIIHGSGEVENTRQYDQPYQPPFKYQPIHEPSNFTPEKRWDRNGDVSYEKPVSKEVLSFGEKKEPDYGLPLGANRCFPLEDK